MRRLINLECSCGFKVVEQECEFVFASTPSPMCMVCPLCCELLVRRSAEVQSPSEYTAATEDERAKLMNHPKMPEVMESNSIMIMSRRRDRRLYRGDN